MIKTAFVNKDETSVHLGGNYHAIKDKHSPFLVIAKFNTPYTLTPPPTTDCIIFTQMEFYNLMAAEIKIRNAVPELNEMRPCYYSPDHQNITGYKLCLECNPPTDSFSQID